MDEVYDKWQELEQQGTRIDRLEVIEKYFTPKHKVAVQLGNMNYQVCNGGWSQWHGNGYSEDLEDIIELVKKGVALKIKHFDSLLNILTNINNLGNPEDYNDTEEHTCFECGGTGVTTYYDDDDNECEEVCSECGGDGTWEEDIDGEEVYNEMLSEYDDEYYNIDNEELLESFNSLLEQFEKLDSISIESVVASEISKPKCKLTGENGNVFNIIGKVINTLKECGLKEQAEEFKNKAMKSHNYNNVLALCFDYVDVI